MEEKFNDVIEKGEKIVATYKPNKKKFWWSVILALFVSSVWIIPVLILAFVLPDSALNEDGADPKAARIAMIIVSCSWIVITAISAIFPAIYYKNKFYCYTDRRIIVRSGVFGIDYSSLEFKSLTATMVQVSLLDKILHTHTGTIRFGSASSQISNIYGTASPYSFRHIEKPYDVLREIKEKINTTQKQ